MNLLLQLLPYPFTGIISDPLISKSNIFSTLYTLFYIVYATNADFMLFKNPVVLHKPIMLLLLLLRFFFFFQLAVLSYFSSWFSLVFSLICIFQYSILGISNSICSKPNLISFPSFVLHSSPSFSHHYQSSPRSYSVCVFNVSLFYHLFTLLTFLVWSSVLSYISTQSLTFPTQWEGNLNDWGLGYFEASSYTYLFPRLE